MSMGSTSIAQEEERLTMSGLLGTVTVDGSQWQRLDFQPRIRSGDLEAVLDLELFIDETGRFRDRGWDFSTRRRGVESILRKIHYIRYGNLTDPEKRIYFRIGTLESVTLGPGLVMWRYRNTQDSPGFKRTGLDLQIRGALEERITVRGIVSSLLDLDGGGPVVGGRISYRPPGKLEIGGTVVVDTDQLSAVPDSVRLGRPSDKYGIFGADVTYHLIQNESFRASLFGGVMRTMMGVGSGTGLSGPGIQAEMGSLTVRAAFRRIEGRLVPGHFDALYELNRAVVDPLSKGVTTREATLLDMSMQGVFGDATLILGKFLKADATYQILDGDRANEYRLEGRASLEQGALVLLRRITLAEAFYEQRRLSIEPGEFFDGTLQTRFGYRVGFSPMESLSVMWEIEYTFEPDDTGGLQRRRTFNLQSQIGW